MHYLADYKTFDSKQDLNEAINLHLTINKYNLNKTDRAVFMMLSQYAVKYYGAAHLKHATIEKKIKKSNSTIRRSLKKLENLNMIKRVKFVRRVMNGIGANIYLIMPYKAENEQGKIDREEETTKSVTSTTETIKNENEPISFKSTNNLVPNTYQACTCNQHQEATQSFYSRFKSHIASLVHNPNQSLISRLYGIYKAHSIKQMRFTHNKDKQSIFESIGIRAISITLKATQNKTIKNVNGYYDGVLRQLIDKALFDDTYKMFDLPY